MRRALADTKIANSSEQQNTVVQPIQQTVQEVQPIQQTVQNTVPIQETQPVQQVQSVQQNVPVQEVPVQQPQIVQEPAPTQPVQQGSTQISTKPTQNTSDSFSMNSFIPDKKEDKIKYKIPDRNTTAPSTYESPLNSIIDNVNGVKKEDSSKGPGLNDLLSKIKNNS